MFCTFFFANKEERAELTDLLVSEFNKCVYFARCQSSVTLPAAPKSFFTFTHSGFHSCCTVERAALQLDKTQESKERSAFDRVYFSQLVRFIKTYSDTDP